MAAFQSQYHHFIHVYACLVSAWPSPSGDESGLGLTHVVQDSLFLSAPFATTSEDQDNIHFVQDASIPFHAAINSIPPVSPSTPFYQPLCSSPTCLSPVIIVLQQLFKLPCHFESVGIFSCVSDILPFELPLALKSRLQPVHCLLPVIEGTLCRFTCTSPPNLSIAHHTSHIHPLSWCTHSFDSPCQPSIHPFSEFFTVFVHD